MLTGAAPAPSGCAADADLDYVCGAERPEDLLPLPQTRWLVASGFARGAGLKLVDAPARTLAKWYSGKPAQMAFDQGRYPLCPRALDPALFNARGLSLRETGGGKIGERTWRLLVVNHRGRESIEVFDVAAKGDAASRLTWRGCMPMGQVGNAVTTFVDGTVLVTVLTRPGTAIADFVAGRVTGGVWQWAPGDDRFRLLSGTELPGNNGLETDPDERRFYVVAFGHAVVVYDRTDTIRPLARIEAPDFMPDNIHWVEGRLVLAGMRLDEPACGGLRKIVGAVADPMLCHRGWVVGELNRSAGRIATVAYGRPQPGFNGLSVARSPMVRCGWGRSSRIGWQWSIGPEYPRLRLFVRGFANGGGEPYILDDC